MPPDTFEDRAAGMVRGVMAAVVGSEEDAIEKRRWELGRLAESRNAPGLGRDVVGTCWCLALVRCLGTSRCGAVIYNKHTGYTGASCYRKVR